jgi:sugar O-acyltransferase (sialic acid O-acetyltransferase NeuD family)
MKHIFVYGAGGHGKVIVDTVGNGQVRYAVTHLIDDDVRLHGRDLLGYPIRGPDGLDLDRGFIAIGDNASRLRIASRYQGRLVTLLHRTAVLGRDVQMGEGSVLMAGAIVNVGTTLGANVIINTAATVDHDCVIEDGVHVAPGCHLCGNVEVGEGSLLGVGTLVVPGIRIGKKVFIHAGQTITRDVPDGETVRASRGRPGGSMTEMTETSAFSSHPA